jgi:cytochrome c oxidase subunit 3
MSSTSHGGTPYYFVPAPSSYPALAALGLFFMALGGGQWINGVAWGEYSLYAGLADPAGDSFQVVQHGHLGE